MVSRRNFLKLMLGGAAALIGTTAFVKTDVFHGARDRARQVGLSSNAYNVRQMITADAAHSRIIMWQSDDHAEHPVLEYRLPSGEIQTIKARDVSFSDDKSEIVQYEAEPNGLSAGMTYEYRPAWEGGAGAWQTLVTPTEQQTEFSCLIFPDSQSADYTAWAKLFQDATERWPNAAFFVNMGDIVDNGEAKSQWQAWLNSVQNISGKIPFVPVMGNHETYDNDWKIRLPRGYLNYFRMPLNGSMDFDGYYYSFDYGAAHFIVLNTQWEELEGRRQGLLSEQKEWLVKDVAANPRRWQIVLLHKDVLQYRINGRPERQEGFSNVGEEFMPLFDRLGIDLVLTAHLHTYRNRGRIYNFAPSAEQGPYYVLTGVAGDVRYPDLWINHALDRFVAPQPETDNYLTLDVTEHRLELKCFLPDGEEIDRVQIDK